MTEKTCSCTCEEENCPILSDKEGKTIINGSKESILQLCDGCWNCIHHELDGSKLYVDEQNFIHILE